MHQILPKPLYLSANLNGWSLQIRTHSSVFDEVDLSWYVMAHGDAREGKWRENLRMQWVASTFHTTSEFGVSSITTADAHISAAGSRLNWRPRRFKWTRPFRRKTKSGFCACAVTFLLAPASGSNGSTQIWQLQVYDAAIINERDTVLYLYHCISTVMWLSGRVVSVMPEMSILPIAELLVSCMVLQWSACFVRRVMAIFLFPTWWYGDLLVSYVVLWWSARFLLYVLVICVFTTCCYRDILVSYVALWWSVCFIGVL